MIGDAEADASHARARRAFALALPRRPGYKARLSGYSAVW